MKGIRTWAACGTLALTLAGCGGSGGAPELSQGPDGHLPPAVAAAKASGASVDPAIVAADNTFGLSLLAQLMQGSPGSNVVIAPISIALALQIAWNGAVGATQQAMAQTLQLGTLSTQELNDANAALQASLVDADPAVTLSIANSLWIHPQNNAVSNAFTQMDQIYYGATIGDLAGAPANVNAWISNATQGLIKQVLPAGDYSGADVVIANAVYFKAPWTNAFDPTLTVPASFTSETGGEIPVEMMQQKGSYPYLRGANFQAVRLPYSDGRFSLLIVLPDPGTSLASLVAGSTPQSLLDFASQMQAVFGAIALPRFTEAFSARLNAPLTALGMGAAFCLSGGDFSGIAPGTCISYVGHASLVQVDESGTVAAGSTVVVGITAVADPVFSMTMDHPFLYAVRDDQTGELLFVGVLEDPT